jgi:hypothetical protein
MEKLDYLVWRTEDRDIDTLSGELREAMARAVAADDRIAGLRIGTADTDDEIPSPSLLLGRGDELAAVVSVWFDSLDDRTGLEAALAEVGAPFDGYLVTESVPQRRTDRDWPDGERSPGILHFTWFPQPERLSDDDFFHGWHTVHTPASATLHPLRWAYVRDSVARPVTSGAPPVQAIVFESFRTVDDYVDPDRLYGSPEALDETMRDLPLYADFETLNSRPVHELILRTAPAPSSG